MSMRVHKAVEPDNLTKKGKAALASLLAAGDGILLLKYDGVYSQFKYIPYQGWQAFSRTGERQPAAEIPGRIAALEQAGDRRRVYIGELFAYGGLSHADINGMARRQTPQPGLLFIVHDSYSAELVEKYGRDTNPFRYRLQHALSLPAQVPYFGRPDFVDFALSDGWSALVKHAKHTIAERSGIAALDGLILRDPGAHFVDGSGKDGGIYKVKPRKSLDLRVTNEAVITRPTKLGGQLTVTYRGVETDVGSGVTQEMLERIAAALAAPDGEPVFIGSIAEVEFLSFTKDGKLREPVLKSIRHDKTQPDE